MKIHNLTNYITLRILSVFGYIFFPIIFYARYYIHPKLFYLSNTGVYAIKNRDDLFSFVFFIVVFDLCVISIQLFLLILWGIEVWKTNNKDFKPKTSNMTLFQRETLTFFFYLGLILNFITHFVSKLFHYIWHSWFV